MYYHVWYEYLKCWSEKFEWRLLLVCVDWSVTLRDDPEIEVPSCLQFLTQCPSFSWIHLPSICPASCPSAPDPVSSGRVFKELASAHPSEEDNKIKIKYVLPASNFNLHMHGEDDSNPWRCCSQLGRCCCPRLIAWPLILAWQPESSSLKLFSKLLYWCEEEEQSQVQTLNDRDALFGHSHSLLWTVVLLKIKS